ncbi:hypothetical protein IVB38_22095 [Bradyrhizobium sp. 38]|uniref:hypothetical protein n=1 Tax=unclassified Bradyrhizobium TaxID=2631580 RepID=UPI001FF915AB|nr:MULTISPECIES: hypothetical protein [unclassified Bradyrhizobium]MCK1338628.1 hypothetical protein [Bradyrhizobium sp. 38]MCK1776034.1 hypothetical protein [Bradyrhizobium sp. 132]
MTKMAVAVLAGRRIDAMDARVDRFPLQNVPIVKNRIRDVLAIKNIELLISSAACGADLLALEQASLLGIRTRIVLPYEIARFRQTSVTDRPGDWGPLFDRMVSLAEANGELITLDLLSERNAFSIANRALIAKATNEDALLTLAIAVWEGVCRGSDDSTAEFIRLTAEAGMSLETVLTC